MTLRDRCRGISLGIFAGDLANLGNEMREAKTWGCDILHFDVMDGVFVPQLMGGSGFVKSLTGKAVLDVHLMVQNPAAHVETYVSAGADIITVHVESDDCVNAIQKGRQCAEKFGRQVLFGVSLMPGTPPSAAKDAFSLHPDLVVILGVDPRIGGTPDIANSCRRVDALRQQFPETLISFDGGVTLDTMAEIMATKPDIVVSGSAVMKANNRRQAFETLNAYF